MLRDNGVSPRCRHRKSSTQWSRQRLFGEADPQAGELLLTIGDAAPVSTKRRFATVGGGTLKVFDAEKTEFDALPGLNSAYERYSDVILDTKVPPESTQQRAAQPLASAPSPESPCRSGSGLAAG